MHGEGLRDACWGPHSRVGSDASEVVHVAWSQRHERQTSIQRQLESGELIPHPSIVAGKTGAGQNI
jgi:hypothetical protein